MTSPRKFFVIAFAAGMMALAPQANAAEISISIGDRPFMRHGSSYWSNGVNWYWVPGHWGPRKKYWIKGHYAKRSPVLRLKSRHKVHKTLLGW